ncbi:Coumaroyl-CoA:anthocyanidin 3-O-glucoside-6''-O-coumaroyltransferase 1, partial [Mucuna pruriens]
MASLEGSQALPLHNRDIIKDLNGLKHNFLEELSWNLLGHMVSLKRSKLVGGNGIVEAAIAIGSKVRDFQFDAFKGVENLMADAKEIGQLGQHAVTIAGSPKMGAYEIDFGLGKPKKCEVLHITFRIYLADCRDDGGEKVGLVLERVQMSNFSTILEDYLRNIASRD